MTDLDELMQIITEAGDDIMAKLTHEYITNCETLYMV